jgi:hypothetical protein
MYYGFSQGHHEHCSWEGTSVKDSLAAHPNFFRLFKIERK